LITVGRGLGELMQRIGQPSVVGELVCGLLLGPSLFGWVWPEAQHAIFPSSPEQKALLDGIAQFGIRYSIASSASARIESGMDNPIAFAVLRLRTIRTSRLAPRVGRRALRL